MLVLRPETKTSNDSNTTSRRLKDTVLVAMPGLPLTMTSQAAAMGTLEQLPSRMGLITRNVSTESLGDLVSLRLPVGSWGLQVAEYLLGTATASRRYGMDSRVMSGNASANPDCEMDIKTSLGDSEPRGSGLELRFAVNTRSCYNLISPSASPQTKR